MKMDNNIEVNEITPTNTETVVKVSKKKNPPQTCPKKHSNFFLTINSQKNVYSMEEAEKNKVMNEFQDVIRKFYNGGDFTKFIKLEGSKVGEKFGLPRNAPREELEKRIVDKIKVDFVIEVGTEQGRLHSHGMVCIAKRGLDTKLDYTGINKYFKDNLGYDIHFKCELFRDAAANLAEYIRKGPAIIKPLDK